MSLQVLGLYVLTWSLVALTPGPAVICATTQSIRHGWRASLMGVMGVQAGSLFLFTAAALGLATLLETMSGAFTTLRILGAGYLLYVGARTLWCSFRRAGRPASSVREQVPAPSSRLFLEGMAIQLANPKTILFVSALLPQFLTPQESLSLQLTVILAVTVLVDSVVLAAYAFAAGRGAGSLRHPGLSAWLERAFGAAMLSFGLRLLFSRK